MWTCQHHCKLISLIYFTVLQLDIENLEIQDQRTVVEDSILSSSFLLFHHLETYSKIKLRNKKPNHAHITITVKEKKNPPPVHHLQYKSIQSRIFLKPCLVHLLLYAQNLYVWRFDELLIEWKIMKLLGYCFLVLFKRKTKYWNLGDEKRWSWMENCGITQGWF
jgi:hypothetical protein